jgi:hypothetical protein
MEIDGKLNGILNPGHLRTSRYIIRGTVLLKPSFGDLARKVPSIEMGKPVMEAVQRKLASAPSELGPHLQALSATVFLAQQINAQQSGSRPLVSSA